MSANKFTDEFKRDAVAQVEDRGYPVREVAERLGVSTKSIYTWQKQFSRPAKVIQEVDAQADEIRRLKRDLARVYAITRKHSGTRSTRFFLTMWSERIGSGNMGRRWTFESKGSWLGRLFTPISQFKLTTLTAKTQNCLLAGKYLNVFC